MASVLTGKRLELVKETIPKLSRVAVLWDPLAPGSAPQWEQSQVGTRTTFATALHGDKQRQRYRERVQRGN
jgi:putative ABC transport system substrate-binding protein